MFGASNPIGQSLAMRLAMRLAVRAAAGFLLATSAMSFAQTSKPIGTAVAPTKPTAATPTTVATPTTAATPTPAMVTPAEPLPRVLLIPQRETTVVAQIVGQVNRLGGDMGSAIGQGATLVSFECSELSAKFRISEAELNSAREQHEAKVRLQGLNAAGEVEVSLAAAAVDKARAQIELSKAQMRQCVIAAPFAGRITKLHVRQYQAVNIGQPLVDLVSAGPLKLKMNAPSKWLGWLKPGAKFDVQIDETGKVYPAVVTGLNGRVDAASQSIEIEGKINGAFADLLAGMSGSARFAQAK